MSAPASAILRAVDEAIAIRGLRKRYGEAAVLDGVDLSVPRGTILGYIGPNGAGKTTTVRILCGLLGEYEGEARVLGLDPRTQSLELKRRIGYVPENAVLYEALTVAEFLLLVGRLHGLDESVIRARGEACLLAFGLDGHLPARIATLSKGMRQKVLITSALLHGPEMLFVDEPLSGLDVNSSILIKEFLRGLAQAGRTVFYCSHVMDVVERICDRIVILDKGRIAAQGSYEELQAQVQGGSLEAIFARLTSSGDEAGRARALLDALGPPGAPPP
ncbi:MAG: ABC transporter ATP-binding protein [Planctomycetes bacterium]|nr:ABC transporter ATP-binding protein [Planctomycetota bacterium]